MIQQMPTTANDPPKKAAMLASIALIRHGVRPLLHIADDKVAPYVSNMVTMAAIAAWLVLMIMAAMILSILFGVASAL